jgi:hypothetical protein
MGTIRVGKPDVRPDTPTHVRGLEKGNEGKRVGTQPGHHKDGTASARRSTGVNAHKHEPILKIMPNLPPG